MKGSPVGTAVGICKLKGKQSGYSTPIVELGVVVIGCGSFVVAGLFVLLCLNIYASALSVLAVRQPPRHVPPVITPSPVGTIPNRSCKLSIV